MLHQLRYGASSTLQLDVPAESLIADCTVVPGAVLADPATAAAAALTNPLNFPPLCQAVVPGDRVVVAVDPDVPQAGAVVSGVIRALLDASVEAACITVLQTQPHGSSAAPVTELPDDARPVQFAVHNPDDRGQLAYLAASKNAAPVTLNRLLCDADLVLPINRLWPESALLYCGPHGGLCPTFADTSTQQRFRTPNAMAPRKQRRLRKEEADEVAWLLGIQLTLQIVAGPGDTLLHILAGHDDEVSRRGRELVAAAWGYAIPQKAELVVATIQGAPHHQSWENVGRALYAAQQVCSSGGTIILCTEVSCAPGPALRRLAGFDDRERLRQRLGNDRSRDAISAWLLLDVRDTAHVFLLSRLEEDCVESLGIGHIGAPEHIHRITERHRSCILLSNADRVALHPPAND